MATVPVPHQFAVGEAVTADNINTYYQGISYLENPPLLQVYASATQSVPNDAAYHLININTIVADTYGGFNTSTHVYTVQVAGIYRISGQVPFKSVSGFAFAALFHNNTQINVAGNGSVLASTGGDGIGPEIEWLQPLIVNDTIDLRAFVTTTVNTQTGQQAPHFNMQWLHP